jgi:Xaa-Pro aminopeptidase
VLLASKRLIQKSLNLDNSCVKLRTATFFLTNLEYSQSIEIDDTFLTFPTRHQLNSEYMNDIGANVFEQLFKVKTIEEIENIMKAILPMLYSSIEIYA